jgi:hypothetical protein
MYQTLIAIGLCFISSLAFAGNCDYSREIDRSVNINNIRNLKVEAGAGSLEIVGDSRRKDVLIKARLCATDEEDLEKMDVAVELGTDLAHFETVFPDRSKWNYNQSARIDLELSVPASALLDVRDSSGEALVDGVAELSMVDSSGKLEIENVAGNLNVVDSSGELTIESVGGDVNLSDSSGGIYVSKVDGSLTVEVDSSGEIEARHIKKDVLIKVDSSGQIDVSDVGGDFTVELDSSGGVKYKDVAGKVRI